MNEPWTYYTRSKNFRTIEPAGLFRRTDSGISERFVRERNEWIEADDDALAGLIAEGSLLIKEVSETEANRLREIWTKAVR